MTSPRWIAIAVLVTVGGLVAGCGGQGSAGPGETSVTPPAVPVSISRTGGIAGANQSIDIAPDGTWVYTDKRKNQSEKGTLAPAQRIQVSASSPTLPSPPSSARPRPTPGAPTPSTTPSAPAARPAPLPTAAPTTAR